MTTKQASALSVAGVLALTASAVLLSLPGGPDIRVGTKTWDIRLKLGLDLLGGTQLIYQAQMKDIPAEQRSDALQGVRDVVERRVNAFGISEPLIQTTGGGDGGRVVVELAGIQDVEQAIALIGETPQLDFREEAEIKGLTNAVDAGGIPLAWRPTELSGRNLRRADVSFHAQTGAPEVSLIFDSDGSALFEKITERNIGKRIAIFLDNTPITAPVVQDKITQGEAVITGSFTLAEAKQLVTRLNAGALPVPISLESRTTVGPTLGKDSLSKSVVAGVVGLITVVAYVIVLYRLPGVIAAFALILYALLNLVAYKILGVTMTLAGVAGFILSIGMAVDANILIFERLKEELRNGRPLRQAIPEGFREAWSSIRDSNVSSLITCVLLYALGSSVVRGFALTLGLGILLSMFSAVTVTRTLLQFVVAARSQSSPRLFASGLTPLSPQPKP